MASARLSTISNNDYYYTPFWHLSKRKFQESDTTASEGNIAFLHRMRQRMSL